MNVQANLGPSMYFDHSVSIHHLLNWHGRHLYISLIKMFSAEHCKIIFVALINNKVRESLLSLSYVYARIIYLFITFRVEIIFIRLQQNHKKGNLWKCLMFQWYSLHCFSTKTIWCYWGCIKRLVYQKFLLVKLWLTKYNYVTSYVR